MNSYVWRTRPAIVFVDIGIALPGREDASTVHQTLGTPTFGGEPTAEGRKDLA
jgi:hypothetical protein